jgi:hypothetical protein
VSRTPQPRPNPLEKIDDSTHYFDDDGTQQAFPAEEGHPSGNPLSRLAEIESGRGRVEAAFEIFQTIDIPPERREEMGREAFGGLWDYLKAQSAMPEHPGYDDPDYKSKQARYDEALANFERARAEITDRDWWLLNDPDNDPNFFLEAGT